MGQGTGSLITFHKGVSLPPAVLFPVWGHQLLPSNFPKKEPTAEQKGTQTDCWMVVGLFWAQRTSTQSLPPEDSQLAADFQREEG